jgi:thymidylate synthase
MRDALEAIREHGHPATASRGSFVEITGVMLELTDIRARLSRSETKGTPFSALGEFCWYMSGRNDFESIRYYLGSKAYNPEKDVEPDGTIAGAYGPRLLGFGGKSQLETVIDLLTLKPTSRQAVLQLFDADDLTSGGRDVPCTCTLQLLNRNGRLDMITYMRSNDVFVGLPHDVFCFTLLQEWMARRLGIDPGVYKHAVGSLHLYDRDAERANFYLSEGYQSTRFPMPPMPADDPRGALASLLAAEEALRAAPPDFARAGEHEAALGAYWGDLVRLLRVHRHAKDRDADAILQVRGDMAFPIYDPFILRRAQNVSDRTAQ